MRRIFATFLMTLLTMASLQAGEVTSLADAKVAAAKSGKLILIDFMTDW